MEWFPGGPHIDQIPMPVLDPSHPWGNTACDKCGGFCSGHFLSPEDALTSNLAPMVQPPSTILKDFYQSLSGQDPSEGMLEDVSKRALLPVAEVHLWLDHLRTVDMNRKRGAAKAAETRRQKRGTQQTSVDYYCGVCGVLFGTSDEQEYWIGCENCDSWYHGDCVSITPENEPDKFYCSVCKN